jgi:hypothetical protein
MNKGDERKQTYRLSVEKAKPVAKTENSGSLARTSEFVTRWHVTVSPLDEIEK